MTQHSLPRFVLVVSLATALGVALQASASAPPGSSSGLAAADTRSSSAPAESVFLSTGAEREYKKRCMACHGATGKGDGPGAEALDPKPQSLREAEWQDSVSDEDIARATVEGGPAVGKSPVMPGFPELKDTPELDGLVKLIRSFRDGAS